MEKLLEAIDIYGKEIKLQLNNKEKITTAIGGFFTLITVIIILISIWIFGKDIFYKENPISFTNQIITDYHPNLKIDRHNFPLAFNVVDKLSLPIKNPAILYFKLMLLQYDIDNTSGQITNSKEKEILLEPCRYDHFPQITQQKFDNALLQTYFCPIEDNIEIEGYWDSNKITYLSLLVYKCNYDDPKENCNLKEEIDEYISYHQLNINVISISKIISLSDYSSPLTNSVDITYKFLHTDETKITNFLIQQNKLFTDSSVFLGNYKSDLFYKLTELQTDSLKINIKDKSLFEMNFYSSNLSINYYRKYIKIYDILAYLGGITKILNLIFHYLNNSFAKIKMVRFLIKNLIITNHDLLLCNLNPNYNINNDYIHYINSHNINKNNKKRNKNNNNNNNYYYHNTSIFNNDCSKERNEFINNAILKKNNDNDLCDVNLKLRENSENVNNNYNNNNIINDNNLDNTNMNFLHSKILNSNKPPTQMRFKYFKYNLKFENQSQLRNHRPRYNMLRKEPEISSTSKIKSQSKFLQNIESSKITTKLNMNQYLTNKLDGEHKTIIGNTCFPCCIWLYKNSNNKNIEIFFSCKIKYIIKCKNINRK